MAIRIVLVDTSHPGNIGSAARALKTMALDELVLVRPRQFPDAEATALASGADDLLARSRVVPDVLTAVADCGLVFGMSARPRSAHYEVFAPRDAAVRALAAAASQPVAFLFGNERNGLSNEDLALCQALVTIPANPAYESLNLAQAVQVMTYELNVARGATPRTLPPADVPATAAEIAHFHGHLATVLREVGFVSDRNAAHVLYKLERLFARAVPDRDEVQILRGVLTAVQQRTRRDG